MAPDPISRLLFVYDADSGKWGAAVDSAKKLLMVKGCALCSLTHGVAGERREWRVCKEELGVAVDYLHRDELDRELRDVTGGRLPCVVAEGAEGKRTLVMSREVLERCRGSFLDFRGKLFYHLTSQGYQVPPRESHSVGAVN